MPSTQKSTVADKHLTVLFKKLTITYYSIARIFLRYAMYRHLLHWYSRFVPK